MVLLCFFSLGLHDVALHSFISYLKVLYGVGTSGFGGCGLKLFEGLGQLSVWGCSGLGSFRLGVV